MTDEPETDDIMKKIILGVSEGAVEAVNIATRTGTKLVIWRDGKILEVTPKEWLEIAARDTR